MTRLPLRSPLNIRITPGTQPLSGTKQMNVVKLSELIDYTSANTENINTRLHIHVFHGDDLFSKFALKMGHYDNMTVNDSVANQTKYYCLKMALDARRSASEDEENVR